MTWRRIVIDDTKQPPMVYHVAADCPKLLEGHKFYACAAMCKPVDKGGVMLGMNAQCPYAGEWAQSGGKTTAVFCTYGGAAVNTPPAAVFGIPTVKFADPNHEPAPPGR